MKKTLKKISIIIGVLIIISLIYGVLFLFNFFQGWTTISGEKVNSYVTPLKEYKSTYVPTLTFESQPTSKVTNMKILYANKEIKFNNILLKSQRYYLPLKELCLYLGYNLTKNSNTINIEGNTSILLDKTTALISGEKYNLRGNLLTEGEIDYICISDIEKLFNLIADFNFEDNSINFLNQNNNKQSPSVNNQDRKAFLIRLEDISASGTFMKSEYQLKFKAMGDLLHSNNIKFHVAWIERYKCPDDNIDNDLLTNNNLQNVGFVNLLDYLINSGGLIGSHGYTHQYGSEVSGYGTELSSSSNVTESETRTVIENAINTATALNIPIGFFESPHYQATLVQKKIIEEYYQYIYEPRNIFIYHSLYNTNNGNLYIPTPLSYVRGLNTKSILYNLKNPRYGILASMFYHPTKELDFIHIDTSKNDFTVDYSVDSPLKQIITTLNENGYNSIHVNQFK